MTFFLACANCIIAQIEKVSKLLNLDDKTQKEILKKVATYLSTADMDKGSPEVYADAYTIMSDYLGNPDIYKQVRYDYNEIMLQGEAEVDKMIENSANPLKTALETSIAGNLLDLAVLKEFSMEQLKKLIREIEQKTIAVDDTSQLFDDLKKARTLLFLGDNCGEIVFDKLFIKQIHKANPDLKIYFAVRGKPAVNDVLMEDALQVKMENYAELISNGDNCLGTVLNRTSPEFNKLFYSVDVLLAKGQGNFESLGDLDIKNIYYLFMTKCPYVAASIGAPNQAVICKKGR